MPNKRSFTSKTYVICLITIILLSFAMIALYSYKPTISPIKKDLTLPQTNDSQISSSSNTQTVKSTGRSASSLQLNDNEIELIDGNRLFSFFQRHLDEEISDTDIGFPSKINGDATATATAEGLIALRILGKYSSLIDSETRRLFFDNYVPALLRDDVANQSGFADVLGANFTLQGTFGVLSTLDLIGRLSDLSHVSPLSSIENFVFSQFDISMGAFAELGENSSLRSTYQALEILNFIGFNFSSLNSYTIYNTTTTINVLSNITNYIENKVWKDTVFNDSLSSTSPIADAWYATEILALLDIHDEFMNNTLKPSMETWIPSLQVPYNESRSQYGGIRWNDKESIVESAFAIGVLFNLELVDQATINVTNLQKFVVESQYLPDAATNLDYYGGFRLGPAASYKTCTINTAYSTLVLLLFSGIWRDTADISLITDDSIANQWNTAQNEILQNENSSIYVGIKTLNYTFHKDLSVSLKVENWTIIEKDPDYEGRYGFFIDINNRTFPLGFHDLNANFSISSLSYLNNPFYSFNDTLNVRYDIDVNFNTSITDLKPGSSFEFNATIKTGHLPGTDDISIFVENENASVSLTTPAKILYDPNVSSSLLSITAGSLEFIAITLPDDGLLGSWNFTLSVGNHSLNLYRLYLSDVTNIHFNDTQNANFAYYLGSLITLNLTLSYNSTGKFPTTVNGTMLFHVQERTYFKYNISHSSNQTFTLEEAIVPTDQGYILGEFNITVILKWDEYGGIPEYLNNHNQTILVKGQPVALNAEVRTSDKIHTESNPDPLEVFFGDSVTTTFALGSHATNNEIKPIMNVPVTTGIGNINGTILTSFSGISTNDSFSISPSLAINQTYNYTGIINPNLFYGPRK
ncbi:MAG: hypothetical protein ACFFCQ_17185 [Promethearchaeota archaeon]